MLYCNWMANILLIALAIIVLYGFVDILRYGAFLAIEPIIPVLWTEIVVVTGCLVLGIVNLVQIGRKWLRRPLKRAPLLARIRYLADLPYDDVTIGKAIRDEIKLEERYPLRG